jgi:hypothetical protein
MKEIGPSLRESSRGGIQKIKGTFKNDS